MWVGSRNNFKNKNDWMQKYSVESHHLFFRYGQWNLKAIGQHFQSFVWQDKNCLKIQYCRFPCNLNESNVDFPKKAIYQIQRCKKMAKYRVKSWMICTTFMSVLEAGPSQFHGPNFYTHGTLRNLPLRDQGYHYAHIIYVITFNSYKLHMIDIFKMAS